MKEVLGSPEPRKRSVLQRIPYRAKPDEARRPEGHKRRYTRMGMLLAAERTISQILEQRLHLADSLLLGGDDSLQDGAQLRADGICKG